MQKLKRCADHDVMVEPLALALAVEGTWHSDLLFLDKQDTLGAAYKSFKNFLSQRNACMVALPFRV